MIKVIKNEALKDGNHVGKVQGQSYLFYFFDQHRKTYWTVMPNEA